MRRRIQRFIALCTAAITVVALSGCVVLREGGQSQRESDASRQVHQEIVPLPEEIKKRGHLVFGSQLASPPLNFSDGDTYKGINIDIAEEIGRRLDVEIKWKQYPFAGLIPAVQSRQVDAGIDLIGDTEERARAVDFSNYMNQATSPLVKRGNPHKIKSAADLCGLSVAIVRGGVQLELAQEENEKCLENGKPAIDIKQFAAPSDARLSVQAGRTAAFLGNTPVMRYVAESEATRDTFEMGGEATYQLQPIGIITAKDRTDLKESIQSALDVMQADGTIDQLLEKWDLKDLSLGSDTDDAKGKP